MRRHFVSGFPRALLSLSQEKSSGVEIDMRLVISQLGATRLDGYLPKTLRYDNGDGNGDVKGLDRVRRLLSAFPPKVYFTKKS